MRIQTQTTLPQCLVEYVLNVFKELQEIVSFLYFPSFNKFLVHFWTILMSSSTPNTLFKTNTKSKTCIYLFCLIEPSITLISEWAILF